MTELRAVAAGEGNGPAAVLEAVIDRTGYLRELEASDDPQDESRVDNVRELVCGRPGVRARPAADAGGHPGRTSSSRSRWSPTPTRSRTRTATAAWSR